MIMQLEILCIINYINLYHVQESNLDPAKGCFTLDVKPRYFTSEGLCLPVKLVFSEIYFPQRHVNSRPFFISTIHSR